MEIVPLAIPEVRIIRPKRIGDARGWLMETYRRDLLAEAGIHDDFCQDNHSLSTAAGTVRGLHCQRPPHAQAKLVSVLSGRILDVALDLRRSSASFGRHVAVELDAEEASSLYIPVGFAHGFCTLTDSVTIAYKVSDLYAPEAELGVSWNDPALEIAWPVGEAEAIVSERDRGLPRLAELGSLFP